MDNGMRQMGQPPKKKKSGNKSKVADKVENKATEKVADKDDE